jgi:hypothetical protein
MYLTIFSLLIVFSNSSFVSSLHSPQQASNLDLNNKSSVHA